ncbi:helix-turn-helix domain-containing protein [Kitasatospora kifunensis]|uniref:Transcriptional regulator with XRE-family HTH domain n=1 Tax=Kitasatospora kifunensis TaxID=58351 RepID=A0A7W7VYW5_KITKI|nr:helix-turn-helix domain-containing protein [Kitasatospora kifunensis]MBB4927075.1 transcriptional regulator with XRE-family HTH domain [Kitasatospora kifunensis]
MPAAPPADGVRPHPHPSQRRRTPLTIHPDNILPDGRWNDRLFELDYEGRRGHYRVVRGLGEQIGTVEKHGGVWMTKDTSGAWVGAAAGRLGYLSRRVAAIELSIAVPLPPPEEEEQYRVVPGFTPGSDMTTAIGTLIRRLREGLELSQAQLAERLNEESGSNKMTRNQVSRWETGYRGRSPGPFWLRHLATVLQVPLHALESADVDRRSFLSNVAATAIAPGVAADLLHHGFASALRRGPSVDDWQGRLHTYGQDYMSAGAEEIQRRLSGDLVVLQQQLDGPGMWDVAAKLGTLYAKTFPGSDGARAGNWYLMAAEAADRSGDVSSRVWVRGRAAIALGYEGASLALAERFADQALALSSKPSLGRLNALMGKAHAAAIRGDRRAALALNDDGWRTFERVASPASEQSDYAVPEWRMNVFFSLLLARLGEERRAVDAQDTARLLLPASLPRFATHLEMHRGLMLAQSGDLTGGVAYARTALEALPPEKHSLTLRLLMTEVEAVEPRG